MGVPKWAAEHKFYELWTLWDRPVMESMTHRYYSDCICHTFSEDSLVVLHKRGAIFRNVTLFRNYFPLITTTSLQVVDLSDPGAQESLIGFYRDIKIVLHSPQRENISAFVHTLIQFFQYQAGGPHVYVLNQSGGYLRANLVPPYVAPPPNFHNQPMITPWATKMTTTTQTTTKTTTTGKPSNSIHGPARQSLSWTAWFFILAAILGILSVSVVLVTKWKIRAVPVRGGPEGFELRGLHAT